MKKRSICGEAANRESIDIGVAFILEFSTRPNPFVDGGSGRITKQIRRHSDAIGRLQETWRGQGGGQTETAMLTFNSCLRDITVTSHERWGASNQRWSVDSPQSPVDSPHKMPVIWLCKNVSI